MAGAVNYCDGYAEGAVIVEEAHEKRRPVRKRFFLPNPRPASGQELADFVAWANA